jgi:transposase
MVAVSSKKHLTNADKAYIRGLVDGGKSQREAAEISKHSRNTVAAVIKEASGAGVKARRTDMDKYRPKNKAKRFSHVNALRREILRLVRIRQVQVYYTGKKQKRMERITVPFGTATRIQAKLIRLRNQRLDRYKKLNATLRKKKAKSEFKIPTVRSIQRHLAGMGLKPRVRPRVPFTPENRTTRFKFCKNADFKDMNFIRRIHFSDEHTVTANDNSHRVQWVLNRSEIVPRETKSKHNVYSSQLWAMVGYNYKSPIIWVDFAQKGVDNQGKKKKPITRLSGDTYIKHVLKNKSVLERLKSQGTIFMQDGATAHTCRATKAFLAKLKVRIINNWPSHSPDLNPIEQIWALLNQRISERQRVVPSSVEELRRITEEEWAAIDLETINKYVLSFMSKCERVVSRKGGSARR